MIQAGIGRYGPYLKYQGHYTSLPSEDDVLTVGINRAVDLLAESAKKAGRLVGEHPAGGQVHVKAGRFGPYVEHNKLRATLGKAYDMADITLETALELLAPSWLRAQQKKAPTKKAQKSAKKARKKAAS